MVMIDGLLSADFGEAGMTLALTWLNVGCAPCILAYSAASTSTVEFAMRFGRCASEVPPSRDRYCAARDVLQKSRGMPLVAKLFLYHWLRRGLTRLCDAPCV